MRIGVVGGGTVGRAVARTYLEFVDEVRIYDTIPERRTYVLEGVLDSDLIFLCLPSPCGKDGRLDVSTIDDFCNMLGVSNPNGNYVLKSTVPIGTTRKLQEQYGLKNLIHSPEFLTARCADTDSMIPACNIIGYPQWERGKTNHPLRELYQQRFPGTKLIQTSSGNSEAIKLFTNGFYAVKVAYFNEIRCLADKLNLDWDTVVAGMLSQGRIAPYHYKVPGPDNRYGFDATKPENGCLRKDLSELAECLADNNLMNIVTAGARFRNESDCKR